MPCKPVRKSGRRLSHELDVRYGDPRWQDPGDEVMHSALRLEEVGAMCSPWEPKHPAVHRRVDIELPPGPEALHRTGIDGREARADRGGCAVVRQRSIGFPGTRVHVWILTRCLGTRYTRAASDISRRQGARRLTVDVGKAIVGRECGSDQDLSRMANHSRVGCERRHRAPDELG